jgi:3-hydroxybutyryl-CoA dehydrogenase
MYEEGFADMATIDWAMKTVGGFKMGPFELMDLIGHDVNYVVTETVWTQFYFDPRFKPSITQKRLLEAGWLGRKTGRGFYDYSPTAPTIAPTEDVELAQKIVRRILVLLINEAADALFLQVASAEDIDTAMTKGVNYPKGLLAWGASLGLASVVADLDALYSRYGDDRYRVCPLLRDAAQSGNGFLVS